MPAFVTPWKWSSANSPSWGACVRYCFGSVRKRSRCPLRQSRADALRNNNSIAVFNRERDADRVVNIDGAAQILEASTSAIRKLIECGVLSARQPVPCAPWTISREQLADEAVRAAVEAIKLRRKVSQTIPTGQLNLIKSDT